ncbi:MAG: hypothetical protein ACREDM_15015, partial [Methylocella sp.]
MPENTENLVLERFAPMRAAVDHVEQRLDDMTTPVGCLETSITHTHNKLAHIQFQRAEQSLPVDHVEARLARMERRFDLADAKGPRLGWSRLVSYSEKAREIISAIRPERQRF